MEAKTKKQDEKKTDKTKERGDKVNLLAKVFEDLDLIDFLPNRDRGDLKVNFTNTSSRNQNSEKHKPINPEEHSRGKNKVAFSASEIKTRKPEYGLNSDNSSKKEHNVKAHKKDKNSLEETTGKTQLSTIKDSRKVIPAQKPHVLSEQLIQFKHEIERKDSRKVDEVAKRFDENSRRLDEKVKITNENTKAGEEARIDKIKNFRLPPGKDLKYIEKDALERRKLRQKYTVKLKSSAKNLESKDSFKIVELTHIESEISDREKLNETSKGILQIETTKATKRSKETTNPRQPIIKTIRNNDNSIYKVTFVEQKHTTPLHIKMPNSKKSVETNTKKNKLKEEEIQSTKEKPREKNTKEKRRIKKRTPSPALTTYQQSPQTEVAKWSPSSINQHTKPYYEAWVDTTLAAIAICSENDKLQFNKQHIIRTFKRALELDSRPNSPRLVYDKVNDEKYIGKITVNKSK